MALHPDDGSRIAAVIGRDAAAQLGAGEWGGERIKPPLARAWRVHLLRARGAAIPEIARRVGMDRGSVQRILNGDRDTKQLYLQFEDKAR